MTTDARRVRLLVVAQAVDRNDPVLGFFHRWLEEFATRFETIEVICLREGVHMLPPNVRVHSLGKERGANRFTYLLRFFGLLCTLRGYDAVFVHMNAEYVLLAGWFWRLMGKRIGLWYNHEIGSLALRLAAPFANVIFHTSPYAYTARYATAKRMPTGIDTDTFAPQPIARIPGSVYFQGRIAPAKNVHLLLDAFARLAREGKKRLTLVGPEDAGYTAPLKEKYQALIEQGAIVFLGPKRHDETPALYAAHEVSVNLTARGNYDKSVFESLACGTPVIAASEAFAGIPGVFVLPEPTETALAQALADPRPEGDGRAYVCERESLTVLGETLARAMEYH